MSDPSAVLRVLLGGSVVGAILLACASGQPASVGSAKSITAIEEVVVQAEAAERGEDSGLSFERLPGQLADASAKLRAYLDTHPADVRALILLARLGRIQHTLEPVVFSPGQNDPTVEQYAEEYAPLHAALDRALALEPDNAEAYYWKARLYGVRNPVVREGKMDYAFSDLNEAIRFARQAVTAAPDNVAYREALALYLVAGGQMESALAVVRDVQDGHHPLYLLLADLQAIPIPEHAALDAAQTEQFAQHRIERGRITNYPKLRVRVYAIPTTAEDVESFYRNQWTGFEFFTADSEEKHEQATFRFYTQYLQWQDGVLCPTRGAAELPSETPTAGIILDLAEVRHPPAVLREQLPIVIEDVVCLLFITNFRPLDSP